MDQIEQKICARIDAHKDEIIAFAQDLWTHAELGQLSPAEFVPVAEQIGQMPRLGLWVLEEACHEACRWPAGVRVSVNVSAYQLTRADFAAQVRDILARSGLSSAALEIELTETAQLYTDERVEQNLAALDELGVAPVMRLLSMWPSLCR